MIEDHLSDLLWNLIRDCLYLVAGLGKAGLTGGLVRQKSDSRIATALDLMRDSVTQAGSHSQAREGRPIFKGE